MPAALHTNLRMAAERRNMTARMNVAPAAVAKSPAVSSAWRGLAAIAAVAAISSASTATSATRSATIVAIT
jgi:hypothetical protein